MKKLSMVSAIVLLLGAGTAFAQAPTYQFAEAGTKNFFSEITVTVGDQINLDLYLSNVAAPQNAGGAWIDFSASNARISYVSGGRCLAGGAEDCTGPWQDDAGLFLNEPLGAGTVLYQVANLGGAAPDGDGDLIVGTLTLQCTAAGDATVLLGVSDQVAFWNPINDAAVVPASLLIHQGGQICISDDECDDGQFCTGVETCIGGSCQDGPDPDCDDGVGCTDDFCDEENDVCGNNPNDGNCDDDNFCNGVETCNAVSDCQAGSDPCDDGLFCTGTRSCLGAPFNRCGESSGNPCQGGRICKEETDSCVFPEPPTTTTSVPVGATCLNDKNCNDAIYCNGEEVCVYATRVTYTWSSSFAAATGTTGNTGSNLGICQKGDDPCPDDGEFCNGSEGCNEDTAACFSTGDPCEGENLVCSEEKDVCILIGCDEDAQCADVLFCNGEETCVDGSCQPGEDPCLPDQQCDEENDECLEVPEPGPGALSFSLTPQRAFRSHLIPVPLFMLIRSADDDTTFDQKTTTVSFAGDAIVNPPLTLVTNKRILVWSLITRAGVGNNGTTEVEVSVTTPEGEGTEILTLILLPLFLSQ